MSRPATRLLTLLELLQDRPGIGGRELAERLEVEPRTVRRYAAKLQELGIPVEASRGRAGGYRLRPGYRLPPLMLGDDEAVAVTLGLLAARRFGTDTERAADDALAKVLRVLPSRLRERSLALHEAIGFTARLHEPEPAPTDTVLALAQAQRRRRRVRLRYRARDGAETTREADPLGVVHHGGRWYAAVQDHLRGELRTFRVDRIVAVQERPERFEPPDGFDAVEHVTRSLALGVWRHEVEIVLHTTLDQAKRRVAPMMGRLQRHPDGVLWHARAERLDAMAALLAGLESEFTILQPPELTQEVLALAERLAASAARRPPRHQAAHARSGSRAD